MIDFSCGDGAGNPDMPAFHGAAICRSDAIARHFQARDGPELAPLAIRSDWVRRHPIEIVRSSN